MPQDDYVRPAHVKIGPLKDGLEARIVPYGDGRPTTLVLSGKRAYARFLLARKLIGNRYDQSSKQSYNRFDVALERPFVVAQEDALTYFKLAGLSVTYDQVAVGAMMQEYRRAHATYSRTLPVENEDGNLSWRFAPGTIDPDDKAQARRDLTYLGWDKYLFPFAFEGACEILTKRDVLLAAPMGTGKSRMALCLAEVHKYRDRSSGPTVILANKRHLSTWREELGGVEGVRGCELLIAQYGPACYEEWVSSDDHPTFRAPFLLVSFDLGKRMDEHKLAILLDVAKTSTVIVDESYVCGNSNTLITQFLHKIVGAHHIALSGTPIRTYVSSLISILVWVFRGGGIALPEYPLGRDGTYKKWNEKHLSFAIAEDGGRRKTPFIKNIDEFWQLMSPLMFRMLRNEPDIVKVLGAAEIEVVDLGVNLSPAHDKTYRAVVKQFLDWYRREIEARQRRGESAFMPQNEILVKLVYLVNNVRAPWRMEDHSDGDFTWPSHPRVLTAVHEKAIEVTQAEVDEGQAVIIFGISVDAMELLAQTLGDLGLSVALVHGGVTQHAREAIFARCRRGEIQVLVGTFGTLSEGLNLNFANRAVIIDTPWGPASVKQALGRITRGIQESSPRAYFISANGTIQQYMLRNNALQQAAIDTGLDKKRLAVGEDDIPDIQAWINSLVGIDDPEEVQQRLFELETEVA